MNRIVSLIMLIGLSLSSLCLAEEQRAPIFPNSDFENGDLTGWLAEGAAFQSQPTRGDNVKVRTKAVSANHQGQYWIGTFENYNGKEGSSPGDRQGDRPTGTLTSEPFTIEHGKIVFLIGGGKNENQTAVVLLIHGSERLKATGSNQDSMHRVEWDVRKLIGLEARIAIIDRGSNSWGHINADDFHYEYDAAEPPFHEQQSPSEHPSTTASTQTPKPDQRAAASMSSGAWVKLCLNVSVPQMPGAEQVEHMDLGPDGCKTRFSSTDSIENIFRYYKRALPQQGWKKLSEMSMGDGSVLAMRKGALILHVTAWPSRGRFDLTLVKER